MVYKKILGITAASVAALLLGACGGGGGGDVAPAAIVPSLDRSVTSVSKLSLLPGTSVPSLDKVDASILGKAVMVGVSASGRDVDLARTTTTVTLNIEDREDQGLSDRIEVVNSDGTTTGAMNISNNAVRNRSASLTSVDAGLQKSFFGLVTTQSADGKVFAGIHMGRATSYMPTTAKATYTGKTVGQAIFSGSETKNSTFTGRTTVSADFGAGTVSGRNSRLTYNTGQRTGFDVTMNGRISGNTYSGTSAIVRSGTSRNVGTAGASNLSGGFYGAGAAETTGAYSATSSEPKDSVTVIGAFGAVSAQK